MEEYKELQRLFKPDYTPRELFNEGIFLDQGGYFRPVFSTIANKTIKDDYKQFDWGNLPLDKLISWPDVKRNKYKVKASLPLIEWERNNWIIKTDNDTDLRGFIGWYCLYHAGRRLPEIDSIQIKRWLGIKNRFGNKPNKSNKTKQLLLNWAIKAD